MMTSKFGMGYLIDGSHPDIKVGSHRVNPEGTRDKYEFRKPRGFKRRARTSHHSSVAISKVQECMEPDVESKGRPSGGKSATSVSASSLRSSTTTSNQGSRVGHRKGRRSNKVVFNQTGALSSISPSRVAPTISEVRSQAAAWHRQVLLVPADEGQPEAQDQQGLAEVHAVSRPSGRPPQMGSANDQFGREEQQEESSTKVICHSSLPNSSSVNFFPLIQSSPMCGLSSMPGEMCQLNPAAQESLPRSPGVFSWGLAWQQSVLQQACWPSQTWLGQQGFCGVGPWPCTPSFGPSFGVAAY